MRILVLGAGATGGYFGGRLRQGGSDVRFLVRADRAAQLRRDGLTIRSPLGDVQLTVPVLTPDALAEVVEHEPVDLIVLSCKAYDLPSAMDAVAPAVSAATTVMPLLNGLGHYETLHARFGRSRVLPGLCYISVHKGDDGVIVHRGRPASLTFGEWSGEVSARVEALAAACARAGVDCKAVSDIRREQWIKLSFLATLAAGNCLMRATVGEIVSCQGGAAFMSALHDECLAIASAVGQPIPEKAREIARASLLDPTSALKASMLHDLEAGRRTEAAHVVGDLVARAAEAGLATPLMQAAWVHLQCQARERRAA